MDVQVKHAKLEQKPVLEKLLKIYLAELNTIGARDSRKGTNYKYLDLYWKESSRVPFLTYVDGKLVGFILVNQHVQSQANKEAKTIAEFFILAKFRQKEIGEKVAFMVFEKFPGKWEVTVMQENKIGLKFWEKVIDKYTGGNFRKIILDNEIWKGPVYSFNNTQVK